MFVIWYLAFVVSTVLHEAAHALTARLGGDNTASNQVSLDPRPHMQREPVGMIVVPVLSFIFNHGMWMFGWASAPYDPEWAYRYPRRASKMALAGPITNLSLAIWAAVAIRLGVHLGFFEQLQSMGWDSVGELVSSVLVVTFQLNLVLFGFNLIPVPPLDGAAVAGLFMNEGTARQWQALTFKPSYQIACWLLSMIIFDQVVYDPLMKLGWWMLQT
jgi:Zn-dependent protease